MSLTACRIFSSPPITPQYNGSVEATGGQLKTRAAFIAARQSCSNWTSDILEAARLSANALNRPWGPAAPTPLSRWQERTNIEQSQREQFAKQIQQNNLDITRSIQREREEKGLDSTMTAACVATVARTAIRQALVELGYLFIRRPATMSTESGVISGRN